MGKKRRQPRRRIEQIWTWDRGSQPVDMEWEAARIAPILETVLQAGLWTEFRKFPRDTIERLLPRLKIPATTRALLEMWIEEAPTRHEG